MIIEENDFALVLEAGVRELLTPPRRCTMHDDSARPLAIIPAKVVVTCYHTSSGWCPCCRKRVESRAMEQPPAANLPHGQLGLNALATGVLLRVTHRLPFRQVSQVLANLPGITVCPGAIARQVQRIANWLEDDYEQLLVSVRVAPRVYADETSWRTDGKNGWLWAIATPTQTVYHIDKSRGGADTVFRRILSRCGGLPVWAVVRRAKSNTHERAQAAEDCRDGRQTPKQNVLHATHDA